MLSWLLNRRKARAAAYSDADELIQAFGADAAFVAKTRAMDAVEGISVDHDPARDANHWWRVRREIMRRTGATWVDTATRYTQP